MSVDVESIVREFSRKHAIAIEGLTEAQVATVLKQVIESGDLARHVQITANAQRVVYVPYAREQELEARIEKLQNILKENGIEYER